MRPALTACLLALFAATATAEAPRAFTPPVAQIERRLTRLEDRVAALEARADPTPTAAATATPGDPYGTSDYAAFKDSVLTFQPPASWPYTLAVGVPNPAKGSYVTHCTLPSGSHDIADGIYDCWCAGPREPGPYGPVMRRRGGGNPVPMAAAAPSPAVWQDGGYPETQPAPVAVTYQPATVVYAAPARTTAAPARTRSRGLFQRLTGAGATCTGPGCGG